MNTQPAVSVLMSTYKEPVEWLQQSIESIQKQTFTDFEFIIICDNPEHTEAVSFLKKIADEDSRIILLCNEDNIGLTRSLNKGLQIARGKYVARMDADDISDCNRLQIQYDFMEEHSDITICGTGRKVLAGNKKSKKRYNTYTTHDEIMSVFLLISAFLHPSVMFRREMIEGGMTYDEAAECAEDFDLWERMMECGCRFANIKQPLISYRESDQQISRRRKSTQNSSTKIVRRNFLRYWGYEITDTELEILSYPFQKDLKIGLSDIEDYERVLEKWYVQLRKKNWFDRRAYQTEAFRFLLNIAAKSDKRPEALLRVMCSSLTTPYSVMHNLRYYWSRI